MLKNDSLSVNAQKALRERVREVKEAEAEAHAALNKLTLMVAGLEFLTDVLCGGREE